MFSIAETLGCGTVDELSERMSETEFQEWIEFFDIKERKRKEHQKRKQNQAKNKRRTIGSGR